MHLAPLQGSRRFAAAVLALFVVMGWLACPQAATAAINSSPWINGSPPEYVKAGSAFWFEPYSADPDEQTLQFPLKGKKFRRLSIPATDRPLNVELPKFSMVVVTPISNSVTLRWRAPTQNVDGTTITDLEGYRVEYGTASRRYDTSLYIGGANITSAVIEGLPHGPYFFAVKAVNSAGKTSDFSNEAHKWL